MRMRSGAHKGSGYGGSSSEESRVPLPDMRGRERVAVTPNHRRRTTEMKIPCDDPALSQICTVGGVNQ